MNIVHIPTWAFVAYGLVLGLVLVLASMSARQRERRMRHAARPGLWTGGARTAGPGAPLRPGVAAPPAAAAETKPIPRPTDTRPVPVAAAADGLVVRPYAAAIRVPEAASQGTNGHVVVCPLCGGGRLAGRILLPSKPGCVWCGPKDGGVLS